MNESAEAKLADVARAAGVSPSTASRALHGSTRSVRPDNRERVQAAARRLGYSVDLHAQAIARREPSVVVIVVDSLTDAESMTIAAGIHDRAGLHGYAVRVAVCDLSVADTAAAVRTLRGERPRALFVVVPKGGAVDGAVRTELHEYASHGGPIIVIERESVADSGEDAGDPRRLGRRLATRELARGAANRASERRTKENA